MTEITIEKLYDLIATGESETVEFKTRELSELKEKRVLISEGTAGRGTIYKIKGP